MTSSETWIETSNELESRDEEVLARDPGRPREGGPGAVKARHGGTPTAACPGQLNRLFIAEVLGREAEHLARMDQSYGCLGATDYYGDTSLVWLLDAVPAADAGLRC